MKEYEVVINGTPVTVLYSDERAKELGLLKDRKAPVAETKAETPKNKAVEPQNKATRSKRTPAIKE